MEKNERSERAGEKERKDDDQTCFCFLPKVKVDSGLSDWQHRAAGLLLPHYRRRQSECNCGAIHGKL